MVNTVWFREADQRAGSYHFEVRVTPDGMRAEYRQTLMADDSILVQHFTGETSCQDAMRVFDERVIKEVM